MEERNAKFLPSPIILRSHSPERNCQSSTLSFDAGWTASPITYSCLLLFPSNTPQLEPKQRLGCSIHMIREGGISVAKWVTTYWEPTTSQVLHSELYLHSLLVLNRYCHYVNVPKLSFREGKDMRFAKDLIVITKTRFGTQVCVMLRFCSSHYADLTPHMWWYVGGLSS